jgi:hypothetical protein
MYAQIVLGIVNSCCFVPFLRYTFCTHKGVIDRSALALDYCRNQG